MSQRGIASQRGSTQQSVFTWVFPQGFFGFPVPGSTVQRVAQVERSADSLDGNLSVSDSKKVSAFSRSWRFHVETWVLLRLCRRHSSAWEVSPRSASSTTFHTRIQTNEQTKEKSGNGLNCLTRKKSHMENTCQNILCVGKGSQRYHCRDCHWECET